MSENNQTSFIHLYQELQKQLVDAHNTYQKAMAESHIAFLNSISNLAYHVTNSPLNEHVLPKIVQQEVLSNPQPIANPLPPIPKTIPSPITPFTVITPPSLLTPVTPINTPENKAETQLTKNNLADLKELLLTIVVEKTGYPTDMLNMDMAIEADLGIDSIKRVEILSTLAERVPHLPTVAPEELAELRTLGDIIVYMERRLDNPITPTGTTSA